MTDNRASRSSERPLAFDRRGQDYRRGPAPVTLILSLILLAGVGGGVFWLYRGGVRAPGGAPEPVGAPVRDVRISAPPQTPTPDPAAGLSVYTRDPNGAPSAPAFIPPPEQPAPRPGAAAVTPAAAGSATPVVQTPAPSAPVAAEMAPPGGPALYPVTPAPAAPAAKREKPASIDSLLADAATPAKPAKRRTKTVTTPAKAATVEAPATSLAAKAASSPAAKAASAKAAKGGYMIQIGAFSSQALADKGWTAAAGVAPAAMAGKGRKVAQVTKAGGAVLYRASITGFATRDEAQALCAKLAAAGKTCFVR